jgi:hypothetical protein
VTHGELSEMPLETLSAITQGVFLPLLTHHGNQQGWPEIVAKEVTENLHRFVANGGWPTAAPGPLLAWRPVRSPLRHYHSPTRASPDERPARPTSLQSTWPSASPRARRCSRCPRLSPRGQASSCCRTRTRCAGAQTRQLPGQGLMVSLPHTWRGPAAAAAARCA